MSTINQKEYLKKYLGIGKDPGHKKKKKKDKKNNVQRVKIIDDDHDIALNILPEDDPFAANEDAPQIVAIIDERPPSLRIDEKTKDALWQPIGSVPSLPTKEDKVLNRSFKIGSAAEENATTKLENIFKKLAPKEKNKKDEMPPPKSKNRTEHNSLKHSHSPPRRTRNGSPHLKDIDGNSPPRYNISDDDNSPPRKNRTKDMSPPTRRHSDDNSPPRRNKLRNSMRPSNQNDSSPPRKNKIRDRSPSRGANSHDPSPPRRNKFRNHSPLSKQNDSSPPRKSKARDRSPSRRPNSDDNSPPRKIKDNSPPRRNKRDHSLPSNSRKNYDDNSPPRRSKIRDSSPPRKRKISPSGSSRTEKKSRWGEEDTNPKMETTLDGKMAGLQNAKQLAEETKKFRERENELFKNMSAEISGQKAQTVMRDRKTGRIRNVEEEEGRKKERREQEEKQKEKYDRWGKGLVQLENYQKRKEEEMVESSKPFARYADDEDLERYLKEQDREGDPMLAYIRSKRRKEAAQKGHVEKPQFEGEFMPNRYLIRPGHRWDGVDRSNGYEKKWFEIQNARSAQEEDTYKWSTEDM